ncbi:MAG: 16S rRNA (cytosine(1402)-N(4))-methyltransferase RsmH [Bacteroidetes bacterium]|nr:16S rRNA (cytosine(1402)-N(4))-methyltransferase RsmH [Bacteroidota bacterium]
MSHVSVLLKEVIQYLSPKSNENFIDCTLGAGGHSLAILKETQPNGKLLGIDLNKGAIDGFNRKSQDLKIKPRVNLRNDNFFNLEKIAIKNNFFPVDGILVDLGLSSDLLEKSRKGFSFQKNEFLDMRFGQEGLTAYEIISQRSHLELEKIFKDYGEEKFSKEIAYGITRNRRHQKIRTTSDLVKIIEQSIPHNFSKKGKIKINARIFQALRIAVNNELENLKKVLTEGVNLLNHNGRIVIISFHSIEDRIVKDFFRQKKQENILKILTKKPILSLPEEIKINQRSRSAKLRAALKI